MQALESAGVKAGQRVLIHAGAGGVGTFAVQLAKARNAHVITTAGPRNAEFVIKVKTLTAQIWVDRLHWITITLPSGVQT